MSRVVVVLCFLLLLALGRGAAEEPVRQARSLSELFLVLEDMVAERNFDWFEAQLFSTAEGHASVRVRSRSKLWQFTPLIHAIPGTVNLSKRKGIGVLTGQARLGGGDTIGPERDEPLAVTRALERLVESLPASGTTPFVRRFAAAQPVVKRTAADGTTIEAFPFALVLVGPRNARFRSVLTSITDRSLNCTLSRLSATRTAESCELAIEAELLIKGGHALPATSEDPVFLLTKLLPGARMKNETEGSGQHRFEFEASLPPGSQGGDGVSKVLSLQGLDTFERLGFERTEKGVSVSGVLSFRTNH